MGFYHPATIVKDAQRHGQRILPIDVTRSDWLCTVEEVGDSGWAVRLGLRYVKGLREERGQGTGGRAGRARPSRPSSRSRSASRSTAPSARRLAAIGAFAPLGGTRRQNVWALAGARPARSSHTSELRRAPLSPSRYALTHRCLR